MINKLRYGDVEKLAKALELAPRIIKKLVDKRLAVIKASIEELSGTINDIKESRRENSRLYRRARGEILGAKHEDLKTRGTHWRTSRGHVVTNSRRGASGPGPQD